MHSFCRHLHIQKSCISLKGQSLLQLRPLQHRLHKLSCQVAHFHFSSTLSNFQDPETYFTPENERMSPQKRGHFKRKFHLPSFLYALVFSGRIWKFGDKSPFPMVAAMKVYFGIPCKGDFPICQNLGDTLPETNRKSTFYSFPIFGS